MPLIVLTKTTCPSKKQRITEFRDAFEGILFFSSKDLSREYFYVKYDSKNDMFKIMETTENFEFLNFLKKHFKSFCKEFLKVTEVKSDIAVIQSA